MSARRLTRGVGTLLLLLLGSYLVGRAAVEPFLIDPRRTSSYSSDWGGPHYLGVLAVHTGGGLIAAAALIRWRRARHDRGRAVVTSHD